MLFTLANDPHYGLEVSLSNIISQQTRKEIYIYDVHIEKRWGVF